MNLILDAFFVILCVVCFGTIIWYNINETSKARRRLREHRRNVDGSLVFSRGHSAENKSVSIRVNRWLAFPASSFGDHVSQNVIPHVDMRVDAFANM